ncbi:rho GTPase-activating protein 21 [Drosophila elegans]|uniref:rho GTPase-activating protein 21 n=1 Tax=Drosophila elegans TaxID=30023 RepID=UPI0007E6A871|nr:rho GTPase-activating protein 21 [Drosophila elegans]
MDTDHANINDFRDRDLAARMRRCNYEKYKSLVRMHLSFELELNTDEFDLPCHEIVYEDKGKLKKWNRLSKKHRLGQGATGTSCAAGSGSKSVGNSPTETLQQQIDPGFLMHLQELKEFLMLEKNLTQEGLFRKAGAVSRQNELRMHIQHDKPLNLELAGFSAHDCATVFKGFLSELPEPLLTDAHYPAHLQIAPLCQALNGHAASSAEREQHLLNSVQLLLLLLPEEHRELLQHIIEMLHAVAQHEKSNKMSAENLATLFTPHLICPRQLPPEVLHYQAKKMASIVTYMIVRGLDIFEVPGKLSTDIRAYFLERKRKKTMSPEQTLDESISDVSTVNTVYTFVDRAATAAATNTNNTDTELAQLYAHIQSMPESSKKRRLIKQFNKQNGQGTPLQLVVMNRLKNNEATRSAKSLGDSIKKHIFHKSLMSRTPKRVPPSFHLAGGPETPNMSHVKPPKMRVLFQSPTPPTPTHSSTITSVTLLAPNPRHQLQKSISSASLKIESSSSDSSSSCAASGSISAPVSRQQSKESPSGGGGGAAVPGQDLDEIDADCCVTPLKIMSAVAKQLIDKKSVAWDEHRLLEIEEYSNPSTPVQQSSRYKSEPNLSSILPQVDAEEEDDDGVLTPIVEGRSSMTASSSHMGRSITRKLMKGVSMGNLRFPFSTPETTKRLVRSVSATLRRRPSGEEGKHCPLAADAPLLEDVDDSDVEEEDHREAEEEDDDTLSENNGSSNELPAISLGYQQILQSSVYRNMDLITSTPALHLGRRSMSPITKSTQRMPKAMQESIMTPRSRKPVMLLNALAGNGDKQLNLSFAEQEEQDSIGGGTPTKHREPPSLHSEDATSLGGYAEILRHQQSFALFNSRQRTTSSSTSNEDSKPSNALSSDFKEYLLTRSVLTASPADLSFASRSDDFGGASTTQDIDDLDESDLSPSLLYCLDGNEPTLASPFGHSNGRKRSACTPLKSALAPDFHADNKENVENLQEEHSRTKKLLITSPEEYPGETAL